MEYIHAVVNELIDGKDMESVDFSSEHFLALKGKTITQARGLLASEYYTENNDEGYLYCMWNPIFEFYGDNTYKLGCAKDVDKRIASYSTSYPDPCQEKLRSVKVHNYRIAERLLFHYLSKNRMRSNREFFQASLREIQTTIFRVEKDMNNITTIISQNTWLLKSDKELQIIDNFLKEFNKNNPDILAKSPQKKLKTIPNQSVIIEGGAAEETTTCMHCRKVFSTQNNMYRHAKHTCPIKKEKEKKEQKQDIKILEKQMERIKRKNAKITKENKNLKKQNKEIKPNKGATTIRVVEYGKEDISKISDDEIQEAFEAGDQSIRTMIEIIHFNEKYPEFSNVYINDHKNKYANVFRNKQFAIVPKKDIINKIYDKYRKFIEDNVDRFDDKLNQDQFDDIHAFIDMNTNDKQIKTIKDEIEMLLYNKRNIPKQNR